MDAEAEWENYTQNGGSWFFQIITWNEGDKRRTSWLIEYVLKTTRKQQ